MSKKKKEEEKAEVAEMDSTLEKLVAAEEAPPAAETKWKVEDEAALEAVGSRFEKPAAPAPAAAATVPCKVCGGSAPLGRECVKDGFVNLPSTQSALT